MKPGKKERERIRNEKLKYFDANAASDSLCTLFGLPFDIPESELLIIPVPWDVTTSYGSGAARGPACILTASSQVDLYNTFYQNIWKQGIAMDTLSRIWEESSDSLKKIRNKLYKKEQKKRPSEALRAEILQDYKNINYSSLILNEWVEQKALDYLDAGKLLAVLGGDHSVPYGLIKALTRKHKSFGIVQFDAHADLREKFEGFQHSHASIMHNVMQFPQISKLVQVGVRDYCEEEYTIIRDSENRIQCFFDEEIKKKLYEGNTWRSICEEIVENLPDKVYISFDIDVLSPYLCPDTGTPVPGGLHYEEAVFLLRMILEKKKKIIAFDLCEVAPGKQESWNANVGARMLFELSCLLLKCHAK
jgi:agmatinase